MSRLSYLDSIGYCKARVYNSKDVCTGRLVYNGAGRYLLQNVTDAYSTNYRDSYMGYNTTSVFVDVTTICEFTKMYAKGGVPVFNNDVIQDDNGILYYICWDEVKSAYVYIALSEDERQSHSLDINTTEVVGNMVIDDIVFDDFCSQI